MSTKSVHDKCSLESAHMSTCFMVNSCSAFKLHKVGLAPTLTNTRFEAKSYLHLALQNQIESCHQMFPDLKIRKRHLGSHVKYQMIHF